SANSWSHSSSRHSSSSAASSTRKRSISPTVTEPGTAPPLFGRGALRRRPVGAIGRPPLATDQRIPAPPECAHLQFVLTGRLLPRHAARDVRPRQLALRRKTALTAFETGDVVRCAKPGGPE